MSIAETAGALEELDVERVHVVLLGDSTLDNARYLDRAKGEQSVEKILQKTCWERGWRMKVLAQDGSMLDDVRLQQLPLIPTDATHVVMSATGNDLLKLLNEMVSANFTMKSMYSAMYVRLAGLADEYAALVKKLKAAGFHVCICTIQHPIFNHFLFKSIATLGLGIHNSRIKAIAEDLKCSVIDLANILDCPEDFANPLEMSTRGGTKLVGNIDAFVQDHSVSLIRRTAYDEDALPESFGSLGAMCQPRVCCSGRLDGKKIIYSGKDIHLRVETQCIQGQGHFCEQDPNSSSSTMVYSPSSTLTPEEASRMTNVVLVKSDGNFSKANDIPVCDV
jgi:hypothetical protein